MNNKELISIKEVIQNFFEKRNWTQRIEGYNLFGYWEDLFSPNIALNTRPIKIQNNTLFLMVKNHIWANEVRIRKGEIISTLNKKFGKQIIEEIIIKISSNKFSNK